jgi:hypothetical protein
MHDGLISIVWLLVNGQLLFASWRWSRHLFPGDRWWQLTGHATLLAYAMVVLVQTLLGAAGFLYPWLSLAIVALLSSLALFRLGRRRAAVGGATPDIIGSAPGSVNWEERVWFVIWGFIFSFWLGIVFLNGLYKFPSDYDTLAYHLALPNYWLRSHSLYAPNSLYWSVPSNNEVFTLWLVGQFSGDFLYALTNLPTVVLLACGAMEVGRCVGLTFSYRNISALAIVTNHIVWNQLSNCENDVAAAGVFVACLGYVLRYSTEGRQVDLVLAATAIGLLAGMKYYALGYASAVFVGTATILWFRGGFRSTAKAAVACLVGQFLFGGYWYLRNALVSGSPLYPLGGKIQDDYAGPFYPALWQSTILGNGSPEIFSLSMQAIWDMTGPCHWASSIAFPVTLAWLLASDLCYFRYNVTTFAAGSRVFLGLMTASAFAVLIVTPFAVEDEPGTLNQMHWKYCPVRYGLCFLSLTIICVVVVLNDIDTLINGALRRIKAKANHATETNSRWLTRLRTSAPAFVLLSLIAWQAFLQVNVGHFERTESLLLGVIGFQMTISLVLISEHCGCFKRVFVWHVVFLLVAVCLVLVEKRSQQWHIQFASFYDDRSYRGQCRQLRDGQPSGTRMAAFVRQIYPFFGSDRRFDLLQCMKVSQTEIWAGQMQKNGIRIVVGSPDWEHGSDWQTIEPWLRRHPDFSRPVTGPYGSYFIVLNQKLLQE